MEESSQMKKIREDGYLEETCWDILSRIFCFCRWARPRLTGSLSRCVNLCSARWSLRPWMLWTCRAASGHAATVTCVPSRLDSHRTTTASPPWRHQLSPPPSGPPQVSGLCLWLVFVSKQELWQWQYSRQLTYCIQWLRFAFTKPKKVQKLSILHIIYYNGLFCFFFWPTFELHWPTVTTFYIVWFWS